MHTTIYQKSPKLRTCGYAYRLACLISLIWRCSCNEWVNKPPIATVSTLFDLVLAIYLQIRQNRKACLLINNTLRGLGQQG